MEKVVFVILHYCAVDITIRAVTVLQENLQYPDYEIVLVDNASPDGSGGILEKRYGSAERMHLLRCSENEGFACGNNKGYAYARDRLHADFIVCMNNDVCIFQKDFAIKLVKIYCGKGFHILGPDIVTPGGSHQNPHRNRTFTQKELTRIIRNRTVILWYLRLKEVFRLEKRIQIIERWDSRRGRTERKNICYESPQSDVVLHGSVLIFSPDFIKKEKEAFWPGTFMWMEEEILTYLCEKKGYRILYDPSLTALHEEGCSTGAAQKGGEKYCFYSFQLKQSAMEMRRLMDKGKEESQKCWKH